MIVDEIYQLYDDTAKRDNSAWNSVHTILYGINDISSNISDNDCNANKCEGDDYR